MQITANRSLAEPSVAGTGRRKRSRQTIQTYRGNGNIYIFLFLQRSVFSPLFSVLESMAPTPLPLGRRSDIVFCCYNLTPSDPVVSRSQIVVTVALVLTHLAGAADAVDSLVRVTTRISVTWRAFWPSWTLSTSANRQEFGAIHLSRPFGAGKHSVLAGPTLFECTYARVITAYFAMQGISWKLIHWAVLLLYAGLASP